VSEPVDDPAARPVLAHGLSDAALEEVNRLWTIVRAFSNTAHDVNNALMVIAGSAELLEARELEPAVRKRVETVRTEAARAATTINRLLTYAQTAAGTPQRTDLWPVVESAAAMRAASANRHRIVLSVERTDATPCWATIDAARTTQALLDLLLAAEDVVARKKNARLVLTVKTGGSMVQVTADATCDEPGSVGREAGERDSLTAAAQLWAARALAQAQGGAINIEKTDRGATLTLTLPTAT
jgi:signal transduction histidine kinase